MLAALPVIASAAPYQQGGSATATVDAGERVEKVNTITAIVKKDGKPDRKSPVGTSEKDFNRSGNPVRIIDLARRLVELQSGQIGVVSEPGEGATFWVTLPGA